MISKAVGIISLSGEIMEGLFGSLDRLEDKFGRVGASIIKALEGVIAQMMAMAALSFALSFIPGAGSFGKIFTSLSGLTALTSEPTKRQISDASGRSMGSAGVLVVEVQGDIKDEVIHLAGKNYIGRQKVAVI